MEFNRKTIGITILSIVLIFAFLTAAYFATNRPSQTNQNQANQPVVEEASKLKSDDHTTWSKDKKILLVEYADFQCPACRSAHFYFRGLEQDQEAKTIFEKVTLVFRHFPLTNIHKNALAAAYAAEAAGKQGKFFEMGDLLFTNQESWADARNPKGNFEDYAKELKLDVEKFKEDMDSKEVKDRVNADMKSGTSAFVNGTPTYFLQGRKLEYASFDDLRQALLDAAARK